MAQSVERHIGNVEVTGPIPVSSFHARHEPCKSKKRELGLSLLKIPTLSFSIYRAKPVTEMKRSGIEVSRLRKKRQSKECEARDRDVAKRNRGYFM